MRREHNKRCCSEALVAKRDGIGCVESTPTDGNAHSDEVADHVVTERVPLNRCDERTIGVANPVKPLKLAHTR